MQLLDPFPQGGADGQAAVLFEVLADQAIEQGVLVLGKLVHGAQDLAERFALVEDPGVHGGDEGVARDEVHCKARMPNSRLRSALGRLGVASDM